MRRGTLDKRRLAMDFGFCSLDCNMMKADQQRLLSINKKEMWPISEDDLRRTVKNIRRLARQIVLSTSGIVWAIEQTQDNDAADCNSPYYQAALHAFNAVPNGATLNEIYDSRGLATTIGWGTPFSTPTIFNGYVYMGTTKEVDVFGRCNGHCLP
jgi:hypothetical protein